jgi:hypothetical protein
MPSEQSDQPERVCLILVPQTQDSSRLLSLLAGMVHSAGVRPRTLETSGEYGEFVSDIAVQIPKTIQSSDAVIVDLTGADPNVMYELGFAHALRKPVLPIIRKGSGSVPSNLQGYLFYAYEEENTGELYEIIRRWLSRTFAVR